MLNYFHNFHSGHAASRRIMMRRIFAGLLVVAGSAGGIAPSVSATSGQVAITGTVAATSEQSAAITANDQANRTADGTTYTYSQISLDDAYVYFFIAASTIALGLIFYALSYLPEPEKARRSQYVSRYYDYAKTMY